MRLKMGKALGLFFGILIGGKLSPLGFIICLYICYKIGKSFDENLLERKKQNQKKYEPFHEFTQQFYQNHFAPQIPVIPFFGVLGHIAKSDGTVRKSQITLAESIIQRLNLYGFSKTQAIHSFRNGKDPNFHFEQALNKIYQGTLNHFSTRQLLFKWMLEMAKLGPYGERQKALLNQAATILGIQAHSHIQQAYGSDLNNAHAILGTSSTDSKESIKKTYRKLLGQYHPDRLPPSASEQEKARAAEKLIAIKKAYEIIQKNLQGNS
jgi:DnaJ like chaperone protein